MQAHVLVIEHGLVQMWICLQATAAMTRQQTNASNAEPKVFLARLRGGIGAVGTGLQQWSQPWDKTWICYTQILGALAGNSSHDRATS